MKPAVMGCAARWIPASCTASVLLLCTGCWNPPAPTARQLDTGLVWMFPGVEGGPWSLKQAHDALRDAGVKSAIRVHNWQRPFGAITNLIAYERNRRDAVAIAESILEYRGAHPDAPIDLVGYSGGGGVAVMVAEALPKQCRLRNVVLAQAAISPSYDLRPALRKVDGKLVSFYSPLDWIILGSGTTVFGTIDRTFVPSAGKDGFDTRAAVRDEALREHFEQRVWTGKMLAEGHYGGHFGILLYAWNKQFVAPYLLPAEPEGSDPRAATRPSASRPATRAPEERAGAQASEGHAGGPVLPRQP